MVSQLGVQYTQTLFRNGQWKNTCSRHHTRPAGSGEVITNTEKGFLRDPVEALWKNCMKLTLQRLEFLPLSEIT